MLPVSITGDRTEKKKRLTRHNKSCRYITEKDRFHRLSLLFTEDFSVDASAGPAGSSLGEARVKSLKYKVTDIRRELVKASTVTETEKIIRMVRQSLPYRKAIPRKDIAKVLQGIYDTLGIHRTAVATDLAK